MLMLAGLGTMRPNTIMMEWFYGMPGLSSGEYARILQVCSLLYYHHAYCCDFFFSLDLDCTALTLSRIAEHVDDHHEHHSLPELH